MRFVLLVLLTLVFASAPAQASKEPTIAPAPDWVEKISIPAADPSRKQAPFQSLLMSAQTRYGEAGIDYYVESAALIQQPQGLAALGNIVIPWQPELADLIIHKVHVVRGGKIEDVLARGQTFTVLRRENNLESAMLDGVLTAAIQPEGLSVGDVVNIAFTVRARPHGLGLKGEHLLNFSAGTKTRRTFIREIWTERRPMRWQASDALGKPRVRETPLGNELVLDLTDFEAPAPPAGAPSRFSMPATLQVSEYRSWGDISALLDGAYVKARQLAPDSPLRKEMGRIAAATRTPEERAMAALRLVQENIRYLALTMGEGGYVPATADQTWSRKFGDCKGKTAALLALLDGLGIAAEPVLVHSGIGDSLPGRLPQIGLFDHVIVKATIGGKSYWLDGTRPGDRSLDALASSPFWWGLPVKSAGAELEKLPLVGPSSPLMEATEVLDASNGFFGPVPVTTEMLFRGEAATQLSLAMAQVGRAEFIKQMQEAPEASEYEGLTVDVKEDQKSGTFAIIYKGTQKMSWAGYGGKAVNFKFDNDTIAWEPDFKRDAAAAVDVPFRLDFPTYLASTQTVILPRGGRGFSVVGKSFDRVVAGTQIARTLSLENGRAVARSIFRRLRPEISAEEAKAAAQILKTIREDTALVRTPEGYEISEAEQKSLFEKEPDSARGFVERGYHLLQADKPASALADFDRAASLDPSYARAFSNRAVALYHLKKYDEAEKAAAKALQLDSEDFVVHQAQGLLHLQRDKPEEAVAAFTRSLERAPRNVFNLNGRSAAYEQMGKLDQSLTDVERIAAIEPDEPWNFHRIARLNMAMGKGDAALAAVDRAIAIKPHEATFVGYRGELLKRLGRAEEARSSFRAALKIVDNELGKLPKPDGATLPSDRVRLLTLKMTILELDGQVEAEILVADVALKFQPDNVQMLIWRCRARVNAGLKLDLAKKDCDRAVANGGGDLHAHGTRGVLGLRSASWDAAIKDYDIILKEEPRDPHALYGRGLARLRKGDKADGERDIAAATRYAFDVDVNYATIGLKP